MLKSYRKLVTALERNRRKLKKWTRQPTWLLCFFGGGASMVAAFYAYAFAKFAPGLVDAANAMPGEQWASAPVLIAMLALGSCAGLAWYYFQLARKPLKALGARLFKD